MSFITLALSPSINTIAEESFDWKNLSSLVSLVKILSNYQDLKNKSLLIGPATPESWDSFLSTSSKVESFTLQTDNVGRLDSSIFVRIAQDLQGRTLFPNLRVLSITGTHQNLKLVPLLSCLISPSLDEVSFTMNASNVEGGKKLSSQTKAHVQGLILDVAHSVPGIKVMRINNTPWIPAIWLTEIIKLPQLTTLDLHCLRNKNSFQFRWLSTFTALESLSVTYKGIDYEPFPSNAACTEEPFLPLLRELTMTASLSLITDIIRCITSNNIIACIFECTPNTRSGSSEAIEESEDGQMEDETSVEDGVIITSLEPPVENHDFLSLIARRWHATLQRFSLHKGTDLFNIQPFTQCQVLRHFSVTGSTTTGFDSTFSPHSTFWIVLESFKFPTATPISFLVLHQIAKVAPLLKELVITLDIQEEVDLNIDDLQPLQHPLTKLLSLGEINPTGPIKLNLLIKLSRYLNKLFPNLTSLSEKRAWKKVHEMIKLCQGVCMDEEERTRRADDSSLEVEMDI